MTPCSSVPWNPKLVLSLVLAHASARQDSSSLGSGFLIAICPAIVTTTTGTSTAAGTLLNSSAVDSPPQALETERMQFTYS